MVPSMAPSGCPRSLRHLCLFPAQDESPGKDRRGQGGSLEVLVRFQWDACLGKLRSKQCFLESLLWGPSCLCDWICLQPTESARGPLQSCSCLPVTRSRPMSQAGECVWSSAPAMPSPRLAHRRNGAAGADWLGKGLPLGIAPNIHQRKERLKSIQGHSPHSSCRH